MHCSHCQSLMFEAEVIRGGHSEQTWYECPVCARVHLYSRYLEQSERNEVPGRFTEPWTAHPTLHGDHDLPRHHPHKP